MKSTKVQKVPPASPVVRQFLARCWEGGTFEGFEFFCANVMKVRAGGEGSWKYVPLELNEEQASFARLFIEKRLRKEKIRIIVLKARKLGISTVVQALALWYGSFTEAWKTKTIAHILESTETIGKISVDAVERFPEAVKPYLAPNFRNKKLVWTSGSEITVETQRSENQSRGSSPSLLHMSEVAFWDEGRKDGSAEGTMTALLGSLEEEGGGAATAVVIETTANGVGGTFHSRWLNALRPGSEWVPLFYPWQTASKHQIEDVSQKDRDVTSVLLDPTASRDTKIRVLLNANLSNLLTEEWARRAADFRLTVGQLRWAMNKADELGSIQRFDQEFPMSADLAFISSGRMVLDTETMKHVMTTVKEPALRTGILFEIPRASSGHALTFADIQAASGTGETWFWWRTPEPGWAGRYALGTDASNASGQDFACISVMDLLLNEQVAEFYCSTTTPDVLARQAIMAGTMFGMALIAPEINGAGTVVVNDLLREGYPNVYRRAIIESEAGGEASWVRQFGVYMDERTRTMVIDGVVRGLRSGTHVVRSERMLNEFRTFRFDGKGKPDHEKGKKSDAIFGYGLAEYGRSQAGELRRTQDDEAVERTGALTLGQLRDAWSRAKRYEDRYFGGRL